jgi:HEAT repeat protein
MEAEHLEPEEVPARVARLINNLHTRDGEERRRAFESLYELCREHGPSASAAVPTLIAALGEAPDDKNAEALVYALHYSYGGDLEPIIDCLSHADVNVRRRACHVLGLIGDNAIAGAAPIRRLLGDADPTVRARAAWSLGLMHDSNPLTLETLFEMTQKSTTDRAAALHALGNIGQKIADRTPLRSRQEVLIRALDDASADVRRSALHAIASLDLEPARYAALLNSHLARETDSDVRWRALMAIRKLAATTDLTNYVALYCDLVQKRERGARDACEILEAMGPAALHAVPVLRETVRSTEADDPLRVRAAAALWKVAGEADEIVPVLKELLAENGESICDLICLMGPAAAPLIPEVVTALETDDWDLQWAAADALGAIASSDPETLAALASALKHDSPIVRSAAARAFVRIGEPATRTLCSVLAGTDPGVAAWAADALGQIGRGAAGATAALRGTAGSPDASLSAWSMIALAKIAGDVETVPALVGLLGEHERPDVRREAAVALGQIGPPAAAACDVLLQACDDDDEEVRLAAEGALAAIQSMRH